MATRLLLVCAAEGRKDVTQPAREAAAGKSPYLVGRVLSPPATSDPAPSAVVGSTAMLAGRRAGTCFSSATGSSCFHSATSTQVMMPITPSTIRLSSAVNARDEGRGRVVVGSMVMTEQKGQA